MILDIKKNKNVSTSEGLFNRMMFAVKAVSKDDLKPSLMNVLVEKNRIVGCDGHRLHITEGAVADVKPGQYWPVKVTRTRIILVRVEAPLLGRYPDIDLAWPDCSEWMKVDIGYVSNPKDYVGLVPNHTKIIRAGELSRGFNYDYFAELLGGTQNFHTALVDMGSAVSSIIFKGDKGALGLLTPVRVDD